MRRLSKLPVPANAGMIIADRQMSIIKGIFGHKETGSETGKTDLNIIFNEYYDRLVYFALQLIKDKEQAEDLVQEAFIKYWEQHTSISSHPLAIKNFLYSTVRNASLNVIRHNKVVESYIEFQGDAEPEEPPVIEAIITAEAVAEIHAALQCLPESHRIISIMGYFEGKKNQEIADELGMSVNTVKKQKQRALELMRVQLSPEVFALLVTAGLSFLKR